MKGTPTKTRDAGKKLAEATITPRMLKLVRATGRDEKYEINAPTPALIKLEDEAFCERLMQSEKESDRLKRRGLRQHMAALIQLQEYAEAEKIDLAEAARQLTRLERKSLEECWVSILEENRGLEIQVRSAASFFRNLKNGREKLAKRIHWLAMSGAEAATTDGNAFLGKYLGDFVDVPDPREARGYVVAPGWVGDPDARNELNKTVHDRRGILVTDCPRYSSMDLLEADSAEGETLEELPGDEPHHRHCFSYGIWVRARRRFVGQFAEEKDDVYVPPSAPIFGGQLKLIAGGQAFVPFAGYDKPLLGCDRPELDLKLDRDGAGHNLLLKHRQNPVIRRSAGSDKVLVWGVDTQGDAQVGEAICEMDTVRYVEWVLNKNCMFKTLGEGREKAQKQLSAFLTANTGPDRMFRAQSTVGVFKDEAKKTLYVVMDLYYQTVTERAVIKMNKKHKKQEIPADLEIERSAP